MISERQRSKVRQFIEDNAQNIKNENFDLIYDNLHKPSNELLFDDVFDLFMKHNINLHDYHLFEVGDEVKVVNPGVVYSTFREFFPLSNMNQYLDDFLDNLDPETDEPLIELKKGDKCTVLGYHYHPDFKFPMVYVIEHNGIVYLIAQDGIRKI